MDEANHETLKFSDFTSSKFGNKRLRINKTDDNIKYFVSRFNDNCEINKLNSPITFISKDENNFETSLVNEKNNNTFYWLLKNASNEKTKVNHKSYVSKKCNLDTDVFFVLIENEEYSDIYPLSSWHVFEPDLSAKTLNKFNPDYPYEKLKAENNNKRLDDIIERLKNKEESVKINRKTKEEVKKKKKLMKTDSFSDEDDDLGLRRQEKKRLKNLMKLKRGDNKEEIEYVNSALSITSLRKNKVNWDYNDDGKKSDDEDLNAEDSYQEEFDDDDDENDDSDNNSNNDESKLTSYGQAMRSLLKQQVNDEEDDELNQYSDDDDDEDDDNSEKEKIDVKRKKLKNKIKKNNNNDKKQKYKLKKKKNIDEDDDEDDDDDDEDDDEDDNDDDDDDEEDDDDADDDDEEDDEDDDDDDEEDEKELKKKPIKNKKNYNFNDYIKEKIRNKEIQIKEENCAKILLKIIEKNNGKMDILALLDILSIKEKNQSFLLIQKYIKNLCNISSQTINNKKVKMISVKPKYLSK